MANFRCERIFVVLDEPVPGLDHLRAIDPVELAWLHSDNDAIANGVQPLRDFSFAPFERPRWRPASEGLATVRALITLYEKWLQRGEDPYGCKPTVLQNKLVVLRQLQSVLDAADTRDRKFYLAVRDLA
jgi:hypothetical protein